MQSGHTRYSSLNVDMDIALNQEVCEVTASTVIDICDSRPLRPLLFWPAELSIIHKFFGEMAVVPFEGFADIADNLWAWLMGLLCD